MLNIKLNFKKASVIAMDSRVFSFQDPVIQDLIPLKIILMNQKDN